MILDFGRKANGKCLLCNKLICSCASWCRCTIKQLENFYKEKNKWVPIENIVKNPNVINPIDPRTKTLWELWSVPKDMEYRWPFIRSFLHKLPYYIWTDFTRDSIHIILTWISWVLCSDCLQHANKYIQDNIHTVIDWDNKSLIVFINNFHNSVNERYNKKQYTIEDSMISISSDLIRNNILERWTLYKPNWLKNL